MDIPDFDLCGYAGIGPDILPVSRCIQYFGLFIKCFSLTCAYDKISASHPFGTRRILKKDYDFALRQINKRAKLAARYAYDNLPAAQRAGLPKFKQLYLQANEEFDEYIAKHAAEVDKNFGRAKFNYAKQAECGFERHDGLFNFYDVINKAGSSRYILEKTRQNPGKCRITAELDEYDCYSILKNNLKRTEVSFFWHCTQWGRLSKTFFFEFNDDTEYWIEEMYDKVNDGFKLLFNTKPPLTDFALYDDLDECMYSLCDDVRS